MGKSINNQGHKVIFVDLMKEDEFSDGIYRESGILDLKTSFGCEFKMYMERKYQSMFNIDHGFFRARDKVKIEDFDIGYRNALFHIDNLYHYEKGEILKRNAIKYLQSIYENPGLKMFYAVLVEYVCEWIIKYGDIYRYKSAIRNEQVLESLSFKYNDDSLPKYVISDQKSKLDNGRVIKNEDGITKQGFYLKDFEDIYDLISGTSGSIRRLMGKNKLVPFKDVSFSNNYGYIALKNENCENKCSVVSDFWLERTVSFKELVILWDFVGEEYVKLNSKEKEEVLQNIKSITLIKEISKNNPYIYLNILTSLLCLAENIYSNKIESIKYLKQLLEEKEDIKIELYNIVTKSQEIKLCIEEFCDISKYIKRMFSAYKVRRDNSSECIIRAARSEINNLENMIGQSENQDETNEKIVREVNCIKSIFESLINLIENRNWNNTLAQKQEIEFFETVLTKRELSEFLKENIEIICGRVEAIELREELDNWRKRFFEYKMTEEEVIEKIDKILDADKNSKDFKKKCNISDINNSRISLIVEYLNDNRFFDLDSQYPTSDKILAEKGAIEIYNYLHNKI